jgi:hypothetical protein
MFTSAIVYLLSLDELAIGESSGDGEVAGFLSLPKY